MFGGKKKSDGEEKGGGEKNNVTFHPDLADLEQQLARAEAALLMAEQQARLAAEARAEIDRQARLAAETRAEAAETRAATLDATLNKPVGECIRDSRFLVRPFIPKWGDPLKPGESKSSTRTAKAWLDIGPDNVRRWEDEDLVKFLQEADEVTVEMDGQDVKLLDVINMGKADPMLQGLLNGTAAEVDAVQRGRVGEVETMLVRYLWVPLERILGHGELEQFPVTRYARTSVKSGEGRAISRETFVPMPPQYAGFYTNNRVIEFQYKKSESIGFEATPLPDTLQEMMKRNLRRNMEE